MKRKRINKTEIRIEIDTGDIWICPECFKKFHLIHIQPKGHRFEEIKEEPPICPQCNVKGKKFITTKAKLYGIPKEEREGHPDWFKSYWTGEYFCPRCRRILLPQI